MLPRHICVGLVGRQLKWQIPRLRRGLMAQGRNYESVLLV